MTFRRKLQTLLILLVGVSCGLLLWMSLRRANLLAFELIQEKVFSVAVSAAPRLDGDKVAQLLRPEQDGSPLYEEVAVPECTRDPGTRGQAVSVLRHSAVDRDRRGLRQQVVHPQVQPVALRTDRGDRYHDPGRFAAHLHEARHLGGGAGRCHPLAVGDRLGLVLETLGYQRRAGGEHRQHRRRGDSSTATAQPAVPTCGNPFEPVLGRVAGG